MPGIMSEGAEPATRPIDHALANAGDRGGRRHQRDARLILGTRHIDRQSVRRRYTSAFVEQRPDLRIERHWCAILQPPIPALRQPAKSGRARAPGRLCRAAHSSCRRTPACR